MKQDGTINSSGNPAARGSIVSLFATGPGQFSPSLADNERTPLLPPFPTITTPVTVFCNMQVYPVTTITVRIPMTVLYAGPAPGEAPRVYQVNVQVPDGAIVGSSHIRIEF